MENYLDEFNKMFSLLKRMDMHLTLTESEQYKLSCTEELMEFMKLKPNFTKLKVDIFVDDGGSYKRNGHKLLLFARNGYDSSIKEYIPFSVEKTPFVMDDNMDFNVDYDDIFEIQDFIINNMKNLILLAKQKITQTYFINNIIYNEPFNYYIAEEKSILKEMATLRKKR